MPIEIFPVELVTTPGDPVASPRLGSVLAQKLSAFGVPTALSKEQVRGCLLEVDKDFLAFVLSEAVSSGDEDSVEDIKKVSEHMKRKGLERAVFLVRHAEPSSSKAVALSPQSRVRG